MQVQRSLCSRFCVFCGFATQRRSFMETSTCGVCGCCVEGFGVRSCVPFCNLMHSTCLVVHLGFCSCLQTQVTILHLSIVVRRCVTCRVSDEPPNRRNVDLSCSRFCNIAWSCHIVGVTMEMSSCRVFVCDLFFFGALIPSHHYTRTQGTCFSVQRCSVLVSFGVAV